MKMRSEVSAAETGRKFKFHILAASAIAFVLLLHLGVVSGIITEGRPLIWPLHNDSVHRLGPGADFFFHASNSSCESTISVPPIVV